MPYLNDEDEDQIPDMPAWFKAVLAALTHDQRRELCDWFNNSGDSAAALDVLTDELMRD